MRRNYPGGTHGGASFHPFAELPHTAALVTNLERDSSLSERMEETLRGEMNRRQHLLAEHGQHSHLGEYEAARARGAHGGPLLAPLLIIIDEFAELLTDHPDLIDTIVAIGRLGRSLGIHLLLATQRLDEGRLRGLDSHLSYRIALRTFSEHESRRGDHPGRRRVNPGAGRVNPGAAGWWRAKNAPL
ncbi:FtsK/SpoIIIE domain-containing protein, partial [Actinotignum timonense]|nr:FtsK/SpoIIIE domain-containing protein [Actinotignum timonense]